jgi:hydroxypyruvate isomerase
MLNFAANLSWMFQEWSFLDRFAAAADAGFKAVEFLFPYEHRAEDIAARLARYGLTQALFNLPPGDFAAGERGMACLPDREPDFRVSVEKALNYARTLGSKRLHLMSGNGSGDRALARYRESLKFACEATATHGIEIVIEPLNKRDAPGYLLNDFSLAERVIRDLDLPNLKLQFDVYHRQILHGDVTRGLEDLMPLIGHIQIASVPARAEPTSGELDDLRIFRTIERLGYQGFIGCEYKPANGTLAGLGWLARISAPAG